METIKVAPRFVVQALYAGDNRGNAHYDAEVVGVTDTLEEGFQLLTAETGLRNGIVLEVYNPLVVNGQTFTRPNKTHRWTRPEAPKAKPVKKAAAKKKTTRR